jgi:predicted kinase
MIGRADRGRRRLSWVSQMVSVSVHNRDPAHPRRSDVAGQGTLNAHPTTVTRVSHLVIIRGNSAAGKSTLALNLQLALGYGTANLGEDHLRREILREHAAPDGDNIEFIAHTARYCLSIGYNVILEGVLYAPYCRAMLHQLIKDHAGPSHLFYLDVPVEETLQRHGLRPRSGGVRPDQIREWYKPLDLLGTPGEIIIDARPGTSEVLAAVLERIGPVPPRHDLDPARFL